MRKPGRCFVAVVEIETDSCVVCLAELDVVQSEADRQADVQCPMPFWSGTRAGNKQSSDNAASHKKCLPMADILSLPICVSRFAVNMGVSRETFAKKYPQPCTYG